jgi:uncharacterized membrane protein
MASKAVVKICDMPPEMLESMRRTRFASPPRAGQIRRLTLSAVLTPRFFAVLFAVPAAALSEAEHAFATFNTEKEVAQAVRNAFVKKVRSPCRALCSFFLCASYASDPPHGRARVCTCVLMARVARSTMASGTASSAATLVRTRSTSRGTTCTFTWGRWRWCSSRRARRPASLLLSDARAHTRPLSRHSMPPPPVL